MRGDYTRRRCAVQQGAEPASYRHIDRSAMFCNVLTPHRSAQI